MTRTRLTLATISSLFTVATVTGSAVAQPAPPPDDAEAPVDDAAGAIDDTAGAPAPVEEVAPVPEAVAAPAEDDKAGTVGYDKGFFIKSKEGDYELKIVGRVQPYMLVKSTKGADGRDEAAAFEIHRARLTFEGILGSKKLGYKLQTDFGKGFVTLKDFYVDYQPGDANVIVRVGQFKRPFSRQQITSSGRLELVERAVTDKVFLGSRDIGFVLHNNYEKSPEGLEWAVGVFNGTGDKASFTGDVTVDPVTGEGDVSGGAFSNVPKKFLPAMLVRVGYNSANLKGYSEADLEGGPLRFGVAASAIYEADFDDNDSQVHRGQVDYIVKAEGLSSTGGFYAITEGNGEDVAAIGGHIQAGYMLAKKYQPVVRFALIDDQTDADTADQQEVAAGLSVYTKGHDFKVQPTVTIRKPNTAADLGDEIVGELQLQVGF